MTHKLHLAPPSAVFHAEPAPEPWSWAVARLYQEPDRLLESTGSLLDTLVQRLPLAPSPAASRTSKNEQHDRFFEVVRMDPPGHVRLFSVLEATRACAILLVTGRQQSLSKKLLDGLKVAAAQATGSTIPEGDDWQPSGACESLAPMECWVLCHHVFLVLIQSASIAHAACIAAAKSGEPDRAANALDQAATALRASGAAMQLVKTMDAADYAKVREAMTAPNLEPGFSGLWSHEHQALLAGLREVRSVIHLLPPACVTRWHDTIAAVYADHSSVCDQFVHRGPSLHMMSNREQTAAHAAGAALDKFRDRTLRLAGTCVGASEALPARRPVNTAELRTCLSRLHSEPSKAMARSFRLRRSDVFIASYPKSGTTWLQQIVHGLRTGGDMAFEEISDVVPWLDAALDVGIDPEACQAGGFRAFKTHATAASAPRGARYIVCIRNPADVLVSMYRFFEGWMFEPGSISIETFAFEFFASGSNSGRYWEHLTGWWERRESPDTLFLCFEDLHADLADVIDRIAAFLNIRSMGAERARVIAQSSFDFMRSRREQFDDHLLRNARDAACGLPAGSSSSLLRAGRIGDGALTLPPRVLDLLDRLWAENVAPVTGCPTYEVLRQCSMPVEAHR